MKILVTGDRHWFNLAAEHAVRRELLPWPRGTTVVHGHCRGIDTVADKVAKSLGMNVWQFPADWTSYGNSAGPIRNAQMLSTAKPDLVLAFHEHIERSSGTKDMIAKAKEAGVNVRLIIS